MKTPTDIMAEQTAQLRKMQSKLKKAKTIRFKYVDIAPGFTVPTRSYVKMLNSAIHHYQLSISLMEKTVGFQFSETCPACDPDIDLDTLIGGKYQCENCNQVFSVSLKKRKQDNDFNKSVKV